jgi:acyl dehydratase
MTDEFHASRTFSLNDQMAFARLSSDWNPMLLDQAFARRTQVGRPSCTAYTTSPGRRMPCCIDAACPAF